MAVFASRAGLDMLHVPYKGRQPRSSPPSFRAKVQSGWSGIPNVLAHIRAGKLKVYAISTAQRSGTLPEVPTAAELGFPGFDIATVIGLQAPAGTPREVVARPPGRRWRKALRERDVAERMANLAMELRENGTEDYVRFSEGRPGALQCRGENRRRQA
jgi:tripartite-type tricarboxylate transporter receptor subunit TctC